MKSKPLKHFNKLKKEDKKKKKNVRGRSTNNKKRFDTREMENEENQAENTQYNQLVLYDPTAVSDDKMASLSRRNPGASQTPKVSPSIEVYTVQCANCYKWRLIPTIEKYEQIRECIVDNPFFCEAAQEWEPGISCDNPPDVEQDDSRVWAIDKPNIPRAPPGWQRILKIRGEGGTKFADVFYATPSGKRLRSLVEVQRFLNEHPEYAEEGILSKFSFQIPKPLHEKYVQRRTPLPKVSDSPQPAKVPEAVPLAWLPPDSDTQISTSYRHSQEYFGSPLSVPGRLKKRKKPSNLRSNEKVILKQNQDVVEISNGSLIGLDIREEMNGRC